MRLVKALGGSVVACVAVLAGCGGGNESQPPPQTAQQQPPPGYYGQPPYNPNAPPPPGGYAPPPQGNYAPPPNTGAPPPAGMPPAGTPTTGGTMPPPATGGAPPPAGGTGFPTIPGLPPFPTGGAAGTGQASGPSAQAIDPNFAGAAGAALNLFAATDAPGMTKEGAPLAGNFQEGQVLEAPITIQPGKCYTIIAAGVGPQELELSIVPQSAIPGLPSVGSLGSAKGTGQKTVLGGGGNCIKLALIPVAVPAKWILKSTRGAGLAAGQVFVK